MKKTIQLLSTKNKYNLLKRFTAAFAAVLLIMTSAFSAAFAEEADKFPRYGESQVLGRGSWSAIAHHGAICYDKDNNPLLCFSTQGGYFFVVDLTTGKVKAQYDIIGEYVKADYMRCGPDNKVYLYYYPEFCFNVYDPIAETYEKLDMKKYNPYVQDGGCMDDDGTIYMGEYNKAGASVYTYNIYTGEERKYGPLAKECHYVKGIVTDENYIYAGTGVGAENARLIRIDKKTGEQTDFLRNTGGGIVYTAYMINNKIIGHTFGSLHIIDPKTLEKVDGIKTNHSTSGDLQASPYDERVFYHYYDGGIWEYNTETQENKKIVNTDLSIGLQWAKLKDGRQVLAMRTQMMEKVGYFDPQSGTVTSMKLDKIAEAGPYVQCLEISPEGIIYCGGYQTSMGAYNINTGEYLYSIPKWTQNEGTCFLNGKTYFGTYTDAVLYSYDPEKPLNYQYYNYDTKVRPADHNPRMIFDIEENQDRPFVMKSYEDKVYAGTMSGYGEIGGAVTIYEEDEEGNPTAEVYRNIVENQSVTGIAFKDNLMYVSGTIRGGLGVEPVEKEAKLTVFNLDTKEVIKKDIKPQLPEIGTASETIGDISFGPDGLLWGVSNRGSLVFALDPETFEVKKYVFVKGQELPAQARQLYLRWGDDGLLYTTAGWNLSVIDPETMEFKTLVEICQLMTLDHNGNIWYTHENQGEIKYITVNQYDRLQGFLKTLDKLSKADYTDDEWTVLSAEISKAKTYTEETDSKLIQDIISNIKGLRDKKTYVKPENAVDIILNGQNMELDYETTGVSKIYNDRTMLPYRAILEPLGYEVKWNVHTNTITAEKEGSMISMVMNNNVYTINGEKVEFDVPPLLLGGRHYVPVRLISEKLGYEVEWNEKENKVIIKKD